MDGIDSDDTISLYFREVGSVPLLSREEEVVLAKRIERGRRTRRRILGAADLSVDKQRELEQACLDGQAAWDHLVKANSRLVISMAKKYRGQGVPFLDLIQEGNVGLMKGVEKFEYRRGYKFSTYATWWIRQAISRSIADQARTNAIPALLYQTEVDQNGKGIVQAQSWEPDRLRILGALGPGEPFQVSRVLELPTTRVKFLGARKWLRYRCLHLPMFRDGCWFVVHQARSRADQHRSHGPSTAEM